MPIILDGTAGITTPMYGGSIAANAVTPVTGFKNRLINGAMVIDQRNAGASVTIGAANAYTVDRWQIISSAASKVAVQQNAGSVTPPAGFTKYLGVTSQSAYSVGSGDYFGIVQSIEGYNIADFGFGASGALTITFSFWVRSSLTGTFGGSLYSNNASPYRSYPFTYTISAANTWEQKTITVVGDTGGVWNTTNGDGLQVRFGLGTGTTYSGGTLNTWQNGNYVQPTGSTSVVGTNGATFYITGVQLEVGSTATSFDYRPYGTELSLCQRYYQSNYPSGVAAGSNVGTEYELYTAAYYGPIAKAQCNVIKFFPPLRASPTITFYNRSGTSGQWYWGPYGAGESSVSTTVPNPGSNCGFVAQGNSPLAGTNIGYGYYTASAEL